MSRYIEVFDASGKKFPAEVRQYSKDKLVVIYKNFDDAKMYTLEMTNTSDDSWEGSNDNGTYTCSFVLPDREEVTVRVPKKG